MPGGWIYCGQRVVQTRGKIHKGAPVRVVLSSSFSSAVSLCCASVGAARSHAAICGRNEMASKRLVSWRSLPMCWVCVAYVAIPWWAAGVTDQPVIMSGRCSSPVSRATLMSFGTRHTPPPLSVVLVLLAQWDSKGKLGGGCGVTPDRPVKAAQIRERPSALAFAAPARRRTTKWKSWSTRNHRVTLALVSLARAIHWRGAWSVTRVKFRPRR